MFYLSLKLVPSLGFLVTNHLSSICLILIFSSVLMPLLSVLFLIRKGVVSSLEMGDYKERGLPLLITALWMVYGYYMLSDVFIFCPILRSEFLGAIVIIVLAAAISKYWKISLHMLGAGGAVGVLFGLNVLFGGLSNAIGLFILLSGLLGSARLNLKAHTRPQIYIGFFIGFFIEAIVILFF